ncbi:hypothetical protein HOU47_gp23 [Arthrobacter phage Constance]|uniref:Uncharacterized protein n=1 Tax=Arthrobacter phage Constance TaxID=2419950 RepID=A0A3G2KEL8_9CAUD|nr:hypothetical protein HOU47_gp23 [Arthrobacter phage Constance]AYN57429.1 hypothetical protein PBI_CONSTANCE_23 [Arthrobacter phage Constance]WMI32964.1 membrane protein [Arthrobacter phage PeggyLeg03]
MDAGVITAIVAGLSALGAGAWKLIDRADKKRERREVAVEALLKAQNEKLEAELAKTKRYCSQIKSAAGKWREQLIAHDIDPVPAEWPEDTHD